GIVKKDGPSGTGNGRERSGSAAPAGTIVRAPRIGQRPGAREEGRHGPKAFAGQVGNTAVALDSCRRRGRVRPSHRRCAGVGGLPRPDQRRSGRGSAEEGSFRTAAEGRETRRKAGSKT